MGFGYLTIGYLIAFLLYLTVQALGVGSLAFLLGYLLMFYGLMSLCRYESAFSTAKWFLLPMMLGALYLLLADVSNLFLLGIPFVSGTVREVANWILFALEVIFQFALLYGIRMISDSVGIKKQSFAAVRNTIFVGIYALLYISQSLSMADSVKVYVVIFTNIFNLVWIACNLLLLLGCTKNICREGDEEITPRRSRFEWVNRMGDAYERTHNKLNESARADGEAFMRRRQEKKRNKKKK
ncbi:MAG: hypothetical protein E7643_08415 [Ruminococcaceae bacterium]|nr:hypothetical protein [Oscillospiraceae bacterium]